MFNKYEFNILAYKSDEEIRKDNEKEETNGYGHTKRKAPLLARSVKLSLFGLG